MSEGPDPRMKLDDPTMRGELILSPLDMTLIEKPSFSV